MAAFNFAGLRFRFGIVLATTTTTVHTNAQQRRPPQQPPPASAAAEPAATAERADGSPPPRNDADQNDSEAVDPTLQIASGASASRGEASGLASVEGAAARNPSNCDERRLNVDDEDPRGDVVADDLGSVAADLREVSEALKLITRRRNDDDDDDNVDTSDVRETSTDENVDAN